MEKFITVVGRSTNGHNFIHEVDAFLKDNYSVAGIHSLGDESEVDGKERFIAFVEGQDFGHATADKAADDLIAAGMAAAVWDDLDEAVAFAKAKYDFGDAQEAAQEKMREVIEKFPPFTAKEMERLNIFDALYDTNKVTWVRGILNEELVVVIVSMVRGVDGGAVTPLAIIVNDQMAEGLEMPWVD